MFDNVGTHNDGEARRRQLQSSGITAGLVAVVAFAMGVSATRAIAPAPTPVPDPPLVILQPLDPPIATEAPPAPPASAPKGGGQTAPEPLEAAPYASPLSKRVSSTVATDPDSGRGDTEGAGTGEGGQGSGTAACPPGADCALVGGGSRTLHHTQLEVLERVDPTYPPSARALGLGAVRCVAELSIDLHGEVTEVRIANPSDCLPAFRKATERALRKWRFSPVTTEAGSPVRAETRIAVRFRR